MRSLRTILPWIVASFIAGILFLMIYAVLAIPIHPHNPPENIIHTEKSVTIFPRDPISNSVMFMLSLVPSMKSEAPIVASIIENHEDARAHQKGLKEAILVFEMIAEGDITRFLAVYRGDRLPEIIEPIRSLRPHFIDVIQGYSPLLLHAGGSVLAYQALEHLPHLVHHDGIRFDGETYQRDPQGVAPHNLFMPKEPILILLDQYQIPAVSLPLFKTGKIFGSKEEQAQSVFLNFGSETHNVTYTYKPFFGFYERATFGSPSQAEPKNVILLETFVDGFNQSGYIPWTQTYGEGKMLLFTKGTMQSGTWKRNKGGSFQFLNPDGNVLPISEGQSWITLLPTLNMVKWE